ncbi:MAG: CDGSH iron-sulfur domain-containing protein [Planctomycetes bacterium]|nr:CDGSH iron-sulfur domain-containing protein [Planctomycetota bacterium]
MGETEVTCNDNGSLKITGNFVIKDMQGNQYDLSGRTAISLCRCGSSSNKPFCDGAHKKINFQSTVRATKLPPPAPKV